MTSDALIEMIERKLKDHGLDKVIPDDDVLAETYKAFHRSNQLREKFEELEKEFKEDEIEVPKGLGKKVRAILKKYPDLRWDDALSISDDRWSPMDSATASRHRPANWKASMGIRFLRALNQRHP